MALSRALLTGMGLSAEQITSIIEAHTETVNGLKEEITKAQEESKKVAEIQKKLDKATADLKDKNDEFEAYKQKVADEGAKTSKTNAYKELLKEAGISEKRLDSILKVTNIDDFEFDENGKFKDSKKVTEVIKKEWADFIVKEHKEGASIEKPAGVEAGKKYTSKAEIMKIADREERRKAIRENPTLFGYGDE